MIYKRGKGVRLYKSFKKNLGCLRLNIIIFAILIVAISSFM